jgi:hypothetical protein
MIIARRSTRRIISLLFWGLKNLDGEGLQGRGLQELSDLPDIFRSCRRDDLVVTAGQVVIVGGEDIRARATGCATALSFRYVLIIDLALLVQTESPRTPVRTDNVRFDGVVPRRNRHPRLRLTERHGFARLRVIPCGKILLRIVPDLAFTRVPRPAGFALCSRTQCVGAVANAKLRFHRLRTSSLCPKLRTASK